MEFEIRLQLMLYLLTEKVFSTRGMKCYCIIVCTNLSIYSNNKGMMDSVAVLIRFVLLFSKQSDVSETWLDIFVPLFINYVCI